MSTDPLIHKRTLGTLLRALIGMLDRDVDAFYAERGIPLRSRYTPVIKALLNRDSATIKQLASDVGLTHSALSQTITQMVKDGLVVATAGDDPRERRIRLSLEGMALLPQILECWRIFERATETVSQDAGIELMAMAERAISALQERPFSERVADEVRFGLAPSPSEVVQGD